MAPFNETWWMVGWQLPLEAGALQSARAQAMHCNDTRTAHQISCPGFTPTGVSLLLAIFPCLQQDPLCLRVPLNMQTPAPFPPVIFLLNSFPVLTNHQELS
ncbi:hypothetical protein B0T26DRAFT_389128 [Lasiosphaeria miniovina]|uniref:Uncharacterized protein n=1 Tax=Lasiosphaeria miniovina TaxID=1954250 RepID=A0AA40A473_9PEZI|nr:uncharacterized protein B0T26DRAFT_389128 [Lasiosphaeria miniovina]KAK0708974.1 hypothetical protein B0T26DRAFT_389128 [Lasiosphaeria miniovina]